MRAPKATQKHEKPFAEYELKNSEIEALKTLATEGPSTGYDLKKRLDTGLKTAYSAAKRLVELKYAEMQVGEETSAGLRKKKYSPTFWGLCNVIPLLQSGSEIDSCVEKYHDIDEVVLANWRSFQRDVNDEDLYGALKHAVLDVASAVWTGPNNQREGKNHPMKEVFRREFFTYFANPLKRWRIEEYAPKWFKEPKVREWLLKWSKRYFATLHSHMDWHERLQTALKGEKGEG